MLTTVNEKDRKLVNGLLLADRKSVENLYEQYLPGIIRLVVRNGGNEADARDVFQDALMVLYRKANNPEFRLTASLKTFLLAVCRNIWRTRKRDRRREFPMREGEGEDEPDLSADTEALVLRNERDRIYRYHFEQLGEQCQTILNRFFAKVKLKDIAAELGLSEKYAKKRKFACKEKLVKAIQADPAYEELSIRNGR